MVLSNSKDITFSEQLNSYNQTRHLSGAGHLCLAPFNNIYFNIYGQAGPCWLTLANADNIKENTIKQIWQGGRFTSIREAIKQNDLGYACSTCEKNIRCGNYVSTLAKLYDLPYPLTDYPAEMEFELSNVCNLECVMCKGDLSSSIRKNREQLPPINSPYNDAFVEQLKEFLPHLKEAKFLGGEPFLVPAYYKIWDAIIEINPKIKITVTTNGTVWNGRVKQILEALHCNIIISIDGFTKNTYEIIRKGSNFDKVMEHFEFFRNYSQKKNTYFGVSINPLRLNKNELADYVNFCNSRNVSLWFNTVIYPYREALWTMPAVMLRELYTTLTSAKISEQPDDCRIDIYNNNIQNFKNLVEVQIKNWWRDALKLEESRLVELKTLNDTEVFEKLRQRIFNYINSDAYIPPHTKEYKTNTLKQRLDRAPLSREKIQTLYTLSDEEVLDSFEKENVLI